MATGLELMKKRLDYRGGNRQGRIIKDKLRSLKAAMKSSYQSETIELEDGRQFMALINPDKLKNEFDNKIISIPFEDVCLNRPRVGKTTQGFVPTTIKGGVVFRWVETDTYWITYLQNLEENAYFRGNIRKCNETTVIEGKTYHVYIRGPVETSIVWNIKAQENWSDLNYSKVMFITKDENTLAYLHRFSKIELSGKPWEVQAINPDDADGIIEVALKETYQNTIEKEYSNFPTKKPEEEIHLGGIQGKENVKPFDILKYTISGIENPQGRWYVDNKRADIIEQDSNEVSIEIVSSKSGDFNLVYTQEGAEDIILPIKILSLF